MKNILSLFIIISLASNAFSQGANVFFDNDIVETEVGTQFDVQLLFNTNDVPISAFDLHMQYESEYLEVVSIETLQGDLFSYHRPPSFDNTSGRIASSAYQIGKSLPGEDFEVMTITFMATDPVELTYVSHILSGFPRTILAYAGGDMLEDAGSLKVTITESALSTEEKEADFGLEIWPNPGSEITQVKFNIPYSDRVQLSIYDANGKLVKTIFEGEVSKDVPYQFEIDLKNLADGTYACRLNSNTTHQTKMMMVTK